MSSYHLFVLSAGKEGVERVYVPHTEQSREEAEKTLKRSQRKRVIGYKLCRPSSWYRAEAERQGLPYPMPVSTAKTIARRRIGS